MTEAEELELLELENENAAAPAPAQRPQGSIVQRAIRFAKEQGPTALGGMAGAAVGTPFGPAARIGGATLGGAAGKTTQILGDYLTGQRDPVEDTPAGNAREIGMAGLAEGAGEGAMAGLGRLKPVGAKIGAGLAKVAANVPEKYGLAAFLDPSILSRAHPKEVISQGFDAFERYTGLQGLQRKLVAQNRATPVTSELERMVLEPANRVARGEAVDPQDLYLASQAATRLKLSARFGEPQAQMAAASGSISRGKDIAEKALAKTLPEAGTLRKQWFESRAKEELSRLLPTNKGGTTNVLRPALGLREALIRGTLGATTGLAALSPAAWGLLIRALPALGKGGAAATRLGAAAAADEMAGEEEELP